MRRAMQGGSPLSFFGSRRWLLAGGVLLAATAAAQDVPIYQDTLLSGFVGDYSYGGGTDFASAAEAHSGTKSISFIGNNFNAVSFAHETVDQTTAATPTLHFWVHGGAVGGQQLRLILQLDDVAVADAELDSYISGGALVAGQWREVTVALGAAPLSYSGAFDRIDLQSDVAGMQAVLYIDDVELLAAGGMAASLLEVEHDVVVRSLSSDRFTWLDSSGQPRVAALAHNNVGTGTGGTRGGELRELRYETAGGTRIVGASGSGASGFGYVVSHPSEAAGGCLGPFDSSSLGHFTAGTFSRVFEGRHHAIHRFTQNYPRYCATDGAPGAAIPLPVTIDWVFSTGRDHPLWSITYDMSGIAQNRLDDDSRSPYGELLFDGAATEGAHSAIAGVGWGDRFKFTSTTDPVKLNSGWDWNTPNTIPYVKLWTTLVDATMGTVSTQPITKQDAGGYWGVSRWNTTSAGGNACTIAIGGVDHLMPCTFNWPYQSINYSFGGVNAQTNNTRLAWGTNFGFLGQATYLIHGSASYGGPLPDTTAPGWPKKSYSTYVVLGTHTSGPVEAQVTQVEVLQGVTLSATTGSVATSGPAGVARVDTMTYSPPGYDPVYGALTLIAANDVAAFNVAVASGTLRNPLFIVRSYAGDLPAVTLGGVALEPDVDFFASLRPAENELWLTLDRDLTGAINAIVVSTEEVPLFADDFELGNLSRWSSSVP